MSSTTRQQRRTFAAGVRGPLVSHEGILSNTVDPAGKRGNSGRWCRTRSRSRAFSHPRGATPPRCPPSLTSLTSTGPHAPTPSAVWRFHLSGFHPRGGTLQGGLQTPRADELLTGLLHSGVNSSRGVWDCPVAPPPLRSEIQLNFIIFFPLHFG